MLELPEARGISKQLRETVVGKVIDKVVVAQSPHGFAFYENEGKHYPQLLGGKTIEDAEAFGGLIEIAAGDTHLTFQDGVNVRFVPAGEALPRKHQLLLTFEDGDSIVCTVQMYGGMWAFPEGTNQNPYYLVAHEKPYPLSGAFDEAYFAQIVSDTPSKLSAKALLATEQRIPGLGNGCLHDILFHARVNPQTKLRDLSDEDLGNIFRSLKSTLGDMVAGGGRDTEKDLFGNPCGYHTVLSKNTSIHPCPVCGDSIVRKAYMGGNVYFCPTCQPVIK